MFHSCAVRGAESNDPETRQRTDLRHPLTGTAPAAVGAVLAGLLAGSSAQAAPPLDFDVSTYAGGEPVESAVATTVDSAGILVMVGYSMHLEERAPGRRAYDSDLFVARYAAGRGELLGVTRLGGDGWDIPTAVAVDGDGRIIVAGHTSSGDVVVDPEVPAGAPHVRDNYDGFVVALDEDGTGVLASAFLEGNADDRFTGIALDSAGGIHLSGTTASTDLPTLKAMQDVAGGPTSGFVAGYRFQPAGGALESTYLTYLGGDKGDGLNAIAVFEPKAADPGSPRTVVAVAGMTGSGVDALSDSFGGIDVRGKPRGRGADQCRDLRDALIVMLDVDGSGIEPVRPIQARVYGSSGDETADAIAADDDTGDLFVVGRVVDMQGQLPEKKRCANYEPLPTRLPTADGPHDISIQDTFQGGDSDGFLLRLVRTPGNDAPDSWDVWLSTYIGGNGDDNLASVAYDGEWIHVAGRTRSDPGERDAVTGNHTGLPVVNALQPRRRGRYGSDGYYARIRQAGGGGLFANAEDIELGMATYVGGAAGDEVHSIAVNRGSVWLAGQTASGPGGEYPFPVTDGAAQATLGDDKGRFEQPGGAGIGLSADAFVARLTDPLRQPPVSPLPLTFSTYFGTGSSDFVSLDRAVVDAGGNLVVVGHEVVTKTRYLPDGTAQNTYAADLVITSYSADGNHASKVLRVGGDGWDRPTAVAVDRNGNIVIAGYTNSASMSADPPEQGGELSLSGSDNGFIIAVDPVERNMVFSEFIEGGGDDQITDMALDESGIIHVSGSTASTDLVVRNALEASHAGGWLDGFVAGFRREGNSLEPIYLSYLGGGNSDRLNAIAIVEENHASGPSPGTLIAVAGMTESEQVPLKTAAGAGYRNDHYGLHRLEGRRDALIAVLSVDPGGNRDVANVNVWLYGSELAETANDIAVNFRGDLFVVGEVAVLPRGRQPGDHAPLPTTFSSPDGPTMAIQGTFQGGPGDGFVLRMRRAGLTGGPLEWYPWLSTYLGGDSHDTLTSVAVEGNWIHVAGATSSDPGNAQGPSRGEDGYLREGDRFAGLPVVDAWQRVRSGAPDGYYARIWQYFSANTDCMTKIKVDRGSYFGGGADDRVHAVVEGDGAVWLVGRTTSGDAAQIPLVDAAQDELGGVVGGFTARLNGPGGEFPAEGYQWERQCYLAPDW